MINLQILISVIAFIIIALTVSLLSAKLHKFKKLYKKLYNKYKDVEDLSALKEKLTTETITLKNNYSEKYEYFTKLLKKIELYDDTVELFSYGLYTPHFNFDTSEKYKQNILQIREQQKVLIKNKEACVCNQEWLVNNSRAEGRKQTNKQIHKTYASCI